MSIEICLLGANAQVLLKKRGLKWTRSRGKAPGPKRHQNLSVVKSKISKAILWTWLLTPFWDSAHLGLQTHFPYCMKESQNSLNPDVVWLLLSPCFMVECSCLFCSCVVCQLSQVVGYMVLNHFFQPKDRACNPSSVAAYLL
jgi:hypothetical protein